MTDEEIRALVDEFNRKVSLDPGIRAVMDKIRNQDADFSDTSRMFWRRSELLRNYLQGVVLDLPAGAREQLCTALLNAGYNKTNEVMQSVQQAQDEPQGIHLNPVLPKRPAERIHTVAHALEDPTVPDDKIVRRAGAPVANVQMSFHDRYIEENARIRAKLGMKPTITRYGSGCCSWCSAVAGKYRFGDQPKDIFRRHDNCNCTIIYDNQVLRGRETSSGRSKTWEEVDPKSVENLGFTPTVNSPEQAKKLQEKALDGLTKPGQGDIMESELGRFRERLRSDSNMDRAYYDTIKTRFSHGSDIAQKAFNKFVPSDSVADSSFLGTPHYDPGTKRISMDYSADNQNGRGNGATWFHEHGHLIDDAAGHLSSDKKFYEALFKDKSAYTRSIIRDRGTRSVSETYGVLQDELSDFRSQSGVSDIFNGLSNGIIQGCATHSPGYWTKDKLTAEAFAHMYEAQFDPVRYEQMKHYFPTALARFEELLGGAVK